MGVYGVAKRLTLVNGKLELEETRSGAMCGNIRQPDITMFGDKLKVECMTISREAFQHIALAWTEFIDEPDKGRKL